MPSSSHPVFDNDSQVTLAALQYLKAIYECGEAKGFVSTSQIALHLHVAPASVTAMAQKLAATVPALVEYHKHHGTRLTSTGEQIVLRVLRRHRLVEAFLVQALGYSWDEVHEDASLLEGCDSARLEERLAIITGNPAFDPHGAPIPGADLSMPAIDDIPLAQINEGEIVLVRRVQSNDAGLLRYLTDQGITIGSRLEVVRRVSYDQTVQVKVNGDKEPSILGAILSNTVMVEKI
jgi:DtxR family transcriptional regulator, Mn-dependent transcriptional regulator